MNKNMFTETDIKAIIHDEIILPKIDNMLRNRVASLNSCDLKLEILTLSSYSMRLEKLLIDKGCHVTSVEKELEYYKRGERRLKKLGIKNDQLCFILGKIESYLACAIEMKYDLSDLIWLDYCGPMLAAQQLGVIGSCKQLKIGGALATTVSIGRKNQIGKGKETKIRAELVALAVHNAAQTVGKGLSLTNAITYVTNVTPMLFLMFDVVEKSKSEMIREQLGQIYKPMVRKLMWTVE